MEELLWVAVVLGLLLRLISLYFGGIACFALKKEVQYPQAKKMRRIAVMTAARNEESVIGGFIESIQKQEYPQELFDVFVIPNNCTDNTEGTAKAYGAQIIHCPFPVKHKGDALHQALMQLQKKGYDAFCIFDSDNIVKSDFLLRINDAFDAGAKVVKGRQLACNAHASWVSGCYNIYFNLFHLFFNKARGACGLSAKLVGTGFAVHKDVLERLGGWNTATIAEDAEFSAQCALLGERVWWVPDAITYDEQPTSFRTSLVQRRRWCSGIMQVAKLEFTSLVKRLFKPNWAFAADFTMFLMGAFAQALSIVPLGLTFLAAVLDGGDGILNFFQVMGAYFVFYYSIMFSMAVFLTYHQEKKVFPKEMRSAIFMFPIFMASWIPLQVLSLFKETSSWKEIRHTGKNKSSLPTS
ncbi:glycosyltransferase family 2 protein [Anaerotignum sp. MB30-C6]|uniref:glycosyltransferase family 2 protein n=1 Tax=Anaerotignum sp. MB30-C6 TaxID=3070814 RepID=UPI0027DC6903|nr:glycosyltransferase family 2 protein [Anaerotignum sp. MB30-C6]WMI80814.1 glycosyltransferase family 2 protein [Anaerotignum sp. MB30-C6]